MTAMDEPRWTIRELGDQVAAALASDYTGPPSGQVSPLPGVRSIRYYAGLGLIDRPAEMRGRTAYYSARHLLQLVAIKRLQEDGRSLAEVQAALTGASDRSLRELARLPAELTAAPPRPRKAPARRAFWREIPSESAALEVVAEPSEPAPAVLRNLIELELAPGVRLQLEADRPPSATDVQNLQAAAAQLVQTLTSTGLRSRR